MADRNLTVEVYASDLAVLFSVASLTEHLSAREVIAFNRTAAVLDAADPEWQSLEKPLRAGVHSRCYECGMPILVDEYESLSTHSAGENGDVHEECCPQRECRTEQEWAGVGDLDVE